MSMIATLIGLTEISKTKQPDGEWVYTKGVNSFVDDMLFPKEIGVVDTPITEDAEFEILKPLMIEVTTAQVSDTTMTNQRTKS